MAPTRGAVWWCDLGDPRGSAPAHRRPIVVVSDDRYNASALRTVTVVALTSNLRRAAQPGNVAVPAELSGLGSDSVVNVTQVATVDKDDLTDRCGDLPPAVMEQVNLGLRRALAL